MISATERSGLDSRFNIIRELLMASPDTAVMEAIALMSVTPLDLDARSSCVLVGAVDRLVGILTERDVVDLIAQKCSEKCV